MNGRRRVLYDVQEWFGFEERAERVFGSFGRWEKVKEYIELYIAKDPHIGRPIPGTDLRALSITNPIATIYYTVDNEHIDDTGEITGTITLRDIEEV
jgi:hypothetical protein